MSPEERAAALAAMSPEDREAALAAMSPEDREATLAAQVPVVVNLSNNRLSSLPESFGNLTKKGLPAPVIYTENNEWSIYKIREYSKIWTGLSFNTDEWSIDESEDDDDY